MTFSFPAKFDGRCGYGDQITMGEPVTWEDDELVHVRCQDNPPPPPDAPGRNERRCGTCFTIHAGDCL